MAASNQKAMVVPIVMEPHPNADKLSIVRVNAYTCVVATEDWQGVNKAIYIAPDTVVPDWPEFAFLKTNRSARAELEKLAPTLTPEELQTRTAFIEEGEKAAVDKLRITAVRLRGVQSFGMLWPTTECHLCNDEFPELRAVDEDGYHFVDGPGSLLCVKKAKVGDDLWDTMGFKRYEPPMPADAGGEVDSAPDLPWLPEYDVENFYNYPTVLQEGEEVVATEKLDGANSRYTWAPDRKTGEYRMFVGSKTQWWKDSLSNMWWRTFRANPWILEFCMAHPDWILFGETFGNVQSLKYDVGQNEPNRIRLFDVLAVNAFIDYEEFEKLFTDAQRVPVIYRGPWDVEKFKALSLGNSTIAKNLREGIVMVPLKERHDIALGRVKLKIVSFDFLSSKKGKRK